MVEMKDDGATAAMELAVQHLRPAPPVLPAAPAPAPAPDAPVPAAGDGATADAQPVTESKPSPAPEAAPAVEAIPEIDVLAESRKMPLDLAVACALIAAKDKGPGIADAILVLGGTSLMEGMQAALQER